MKQLICFIFLLNSLYSSSQQSYFHSNTIRDTIYSQALSMNKAYQVFLPESYNYTEASSYPIIYLIDGDYNFYYQTGIIEALANVSEQIPEMIVVGIADNGNAGYRKDCTLKSADNPNGNAKHFINYLANELKPEIEKKYRVSTKQILVGHSLGGLFATSVMLTRPELFSDYLAIDPSYWWANKHIVSLADSVLKNLNKLPAQLFISLADSKQMGVHEFVGTLENYFPESEKWSFNYYPNENHGSVGIISLRDGLRHIFNKWVLSREEFYNLKSSQKVMAHYDTVRNNYGEISRLPPNLFSNIIYYYFRNEKSKELEYIEQEVLKKYPASIDDYYAKLAGYHIEKEKYEAAHKLINKCISTYPLAYKSYDSQAKLYLAEGQVNEARVAALKALQIAEQLKVRQWQLNELQASLDIIKNLK